jgi:hypothetical protein
MYEADTLRRVRQVLLAALVAGMAGTTAELLLIGHFESLSQRAPLALLASGLVAALWHAARPRRATVLALQALMAAFLLAGAIGIGLHYAGMELVQNTLTGATPVLAPGSMALLGLVGLAHAYRHPSLVKETGNVAVSEEQP